MGRRAGQLFERGMESRNVSFSISAGSRNKADLWLAFAAQIQDVLIEERILRLHRKPAAPHCNDLPRLLQCLLHVRVPAYQSRDQSGLRSIGSGTDSLAEQESDCAWIT